MWIDTHCHLDAAEFAADRDAVVARALSAGVRLQVLPAVEVANFDAVRQLAHRHGLAYALGIHPLAVERATDADLERLAEALAAHVQDHRQLKLARRFELPVILHVRRSADTLLKHLRRQPVRGGIAHAFNGSGQQAQAFVELGFKLGFGGALTFERALQIRRLAQSLPLDAIVMETDSPDIPPHWLYRTAEERAAGASPLRNEPAELPRIGAELAALRGLDAPALAAATSANAHAALPGLAAVAAWSA